MKKETIWLYPGSFDPVTYGHTDIIRRASKLCDRLIVGVVDKNKQKKSTLFSLSDRVRMIESVIGDFGNVYVRTFDSLQADFYREIGADAVVRGIRSTSDFETEFLMDATERMLLHNFETVLMLSAPELSAVSSSTVRIIAGYGGDISGFVPPAVETLIRERFGVKYGQ